MSHKHVKTQPELQIHGEFSGKLFLPVFFCRSPLTQLGRPGRPGAIRMCSRLQQQAGDLQLALHRCELQATLGIRVSVCVQKMTHNPGGADPCQGI